MLPSRGVLPAGSFECGEEHAPARRATQCAINWKHWLEIDPDAKRVEPTPKIGRTRRGQPGARFLALHTRRIRVAFASRRRCARASRTHPPRHLVARSHLAPFLAWRAMVPMSSMSPKVPKSRRWAA